MLSTLEQVHEQLRACDKQLQQLAEKYPDVVASWMARARRESVSAIVKASWAL